MTETDPGTVEFTTKAGFTGVYYARVAAAAMWKGEYNPYQPKRWEGRLVQIADVTAEQEKRVRRNQ